jgi:CHASE3 domain sensor protein
MSEKLKYGTLFLFVSGVILIVFLQFLSGENINRLVARNKTLLNEVSLQNDLRKLEADVLTVESDIRGLVITGDSTSLPAVQDKISNIEKEVDVLQSLLQEGNTADEVAHLNNLVSEKIGFSKMVLEAYRDGGKAAGEAVINTGVASTSATASWR